MTTLHSARRCRLQPMVTPLEDRKLMSGVSHAVDAEAKRHVADCHPTHPSDATPSKWAWLANTYWYVPAPNLAAVVYEPSSGALIPVQDQTVYHIIEYSRGYFWGQTVSQFNSATPTSSALVASVTPQGHVLLNFVGSSAATEGIGTMVKKGGQWTMENQMFTGSSSASAQVGHWAYMVQTRPGMKSWNLLPSAGVSVPTFMSYYSEPTPTPLV